MPLCSPCLFIMGHLSPQQPALAVLSSFLSPFIIGHLSPQQDILPSFILPLQHAILPSLPRAHILASVPHLPSLQQSIALPSLSLQQAHDLSSAFGVTFGVAVWAKSAMVNSRTTRMTVSFAFMISFPFMISLIRLGGRQNCFVVLKFSWQRQI